MHSGVYTLWETRPNPLLGRPGRKEGGRVEFVIEPLLAPALVRPEHERHVLFVRLTAPRTAGSRVVAVAPDVGGAVRAALAQTEDGPVRRGVIVGADALFVEGADARDRALAAFVDVVRAFVDAGTPFVWRTRAGVGQGGLPPVVAHALASAGRLCTVEIGVATIDDDDARALEGAYASPARARLLLASSLVARGVGVRALVDPLVPMLTDQQGPLEDLVCALAAAGVRKLGARYITLTRDRAKLIAARLAGMQKALLQGVFADEPWRQPGVSDTDAAGPREVHKRIPASLRRRGHERLIEIGSRHGVVVEILDPVDAAELQHPEAAAPPARPRPTRSPRPQLELFQSRRRCRLARPPPPRRRRNGMATPNA
jgi:hypothetical protein